MYVPPDYAKIYNTLLEKSKSYSATSDIEDKKCRLIKKIFKDSIITQENWIKTIVYIIEKEPNEDILRIVVQNVRLYVDRLFQQDYMIYPDCAKIILYTIEISPDENILQDIIEKTFSLDITLFKSLYKNLVNNSLKNRNPGVLVRHSITLALDAENNNDRASLLLNKLSFVLNVEPCPLILISAIIQIMKILQIEQNVQLQIDWQRIQDILSYAESDNNEDLIAAITELNELSLQITCQVSC